MYLMPATWMFDHTVEQEWFKATTSIMVTTAGPSHTNPAQDDTLKATNGLQW